MQIKIVENIKNEMEKDIQNIEQGTAYPKKKIVMTPETFSKVFTPQRIRLLMAIRKNNIKSISELARNLKRKFEAVHRDISYLKGVGLIALVKQNNKVIPKVYETIKIPAIA
ncbi:hypothetical protein HYY69_03715 [Candidatus Woesearchaeota archaeon]|nr:hypothetical protein [Candidatus Woesearchaeota archaeon]